MRSASAVGERTKERARGGGDLLGDDQAGGRLAVNWTPVPSHLISPHPAQASLTGESDPIKKDLETDPWLRAGTQAGPAWVDGGEQLASTAALGGSRGYGRCCGARRRAGTSPLTMHARAALP
jgi:hypothetical protein